jgi:hypothetical protein
MLLSAMALALPAMVAATPDSSATVQFGTDRGSSFPPPDGHDASSNAKDNMIPRTVTIAADGSVTFNILAVAPGVHQPMIYAPGTTPDDIDVPQFPPVAFMNEDEGLVEAGPATPSGTWTTSAGTFRDPGKYLVLCNFTPHFAFFNMYGWVDVKRAK